MTVFSYTTSSGISKFSSDSEERGVHSYNESSAVYVVDEDFGDIVANVDIDEDYGSVVDNNLTGWQTADYGLITVNETIVPYGSIDVGNNDIATLKLIRVGISNVISFSILGEAFIFTTPIEKGSGTLRIFGSSGDPIFALTHYGSGSLFALSSATEVKGSNPPEETVLFRFSGSAVEKNTESYVGTGSLFTLESKTEIFSSAQQAQGLFRVSGFSVVISSLSHYGSGTLFGFTGSSEDTTVDPPDSTLLATFTGDAEYQFFKNNTINTEGSLILRGQSTNTFAIAYSADVLIAIDGSATESITPAPHIGSGKLFAITGSSESITRDPQDLTTLFTFSGQSVEQSTDSEVGFGLARFGSDTAYSIFRLGHIGEVQLDIEGRAAESISPAPHIGSGRLFAFTGSSESVTRDPQDLTTLFEISGEASYKLTSTHLGRVNLDVEGKATTIFNLSHIGSGSLFTFTSTTESISVNPPEETALFKFVGSAVEKNTEAYRGSGSLFTFTSTTESVSNAESSKGLFRISGLSRNIFVINNIGSGSLFGFSSTTESIALSPDDTQVLFTFSGTAVEKNTESYRGSGSLFGFSSATESSSNVEIVKGLFKISGSVRDIFVVKNIGSGSLFGFSSATESISINPPEETVLFRFTGSAVEKNTESYRGSGSLFGFSSTTEAVGANPPEFAPVLRLTGTAAESFVPAPHIAVGSLFAFGSATETRSISPQVSGVFTFTGSVVEKKSRSYVGYGSLFGFSSTTESFAITPSTFAPLFKISGVVAESFIPAPHIGFGSLRTLSGAAETRSVSPKVSVLFEFYGNAVERSARSQLGSGSLFGITGSNDASVVIPKIAGVLFTLFGGVGESYTPAPEIGTGLVNLEGLSLDRKIIFVPPVPPRILVI